MRHGKKFRHLTRDASHRKAMLANLSNSLIEHKRIKTTLPKAKALRKYVEPLLTKAKTDTTHSRRITFRYLRNKEVIKELFDNVAEKIANRYGGYTRILKLGPRKGDNAEMALVELVDYNENLQKEQKEKKRTRRRGGRRRGGKKGQGQQQQTDQSQQEEQEGDVAAAGTETASTDQSEEATAEKETKQQQNEASGEAQDGGQNEQQAETQQQGEASAEESQENQESSSDKEEGDQNGGEGSDNNEKDEDNKKE